MLIVLVALVGGGLLALNAVGLIQLIPLHGRAALGIPAEAELPVDLIYDENGLAIYNDSALPRFRSMGWCWIGARIAS